MANRGKKYTAAEKHFMEKQKSYEQTIKQLRARVSQLEQEKKDLAKQITDQENLKRQLAYLQQYCGATPAEATAAFEADLAKNETYAMFSSMLRGLRTLPY